MKDRYNVQNLLYDLALIMASALYLKDLVHLLLRELISRMHISRGAFVLIEEDRIYEVAHEGYIFAPEFDEEEIKTLLGQPQTLVLEELEEGQLKNIMHKLDVTVVVRLHTEGKNIGLLLLGKKKDKEIYTPKDLQVLEIFAPEATIAIQNAQSFEEIRRFNITLEQKIGKATNELHKVNEEVYKKNVTLAKISKELVLANKKLKTLDKLKDEFISLASHELRTPMTAIKSYLWMVLEGRGGEITEKQKDYLDRAYKSTDRLIALINDMLDVSRIESGRIVLDLKAIKLEELVDDVVSELKPKADELGSLIAVVLTKTLPEVLADYNKIKEVLINLVGNSLKFTPREGRITIRLTQKDNMIETEVSDTGTGIKSQDLPKLFQKFSMVGDSVQKQQNPQGTGLGLYISKAIVELHGGKIWATSDGIGKGAAFGFTLKAAAQGR